MILTIGYFCVLTILTIVLHILVIWERLIHSSKIKMLGFYFTLDQFENNWIVISLVQFTVNLPKTVCVKAHTGKRWILNKNIIFHSSVSFLYHSKIKWKAIHIFVFEGNIFFIFWKMPLI